MAGTIGRSNVTCDADADGVAVIRGLKTLADRYKMQYKLPIYSTSFRPFLAFGFYKRKKPWTTLDEKTEDCEFVSCAPRSRCCRLNTVLHLGSKTGDALVKSLLVASPSGKQLDPLQRSTSSQGNRSKSYKLVGYTTKYFNFQQIS